MKKHPAYARKLHLLAHVTVAVVALAAALWVVQIAIPALQAVSFSVADTKETTSAQAAATPHAPEVAHVRTPAHVRGIYMSQCVVGTPSFRDSLISFVKQSSLNTVVIDIRDYTGKIAFPTDNPALRDAVSDACGAKDMKSFIEKLHADDIYVIGRITTFQNPYYTQKHPEQAVQRKGGGVWKDNKGLAFVDVGAKQYWDNVVELGKISYELGFDELNFDYMRFPSDGPMSEAVYSFGAGKSKEEALEDFFKYLTDRLRPTGAVLSVDLFGMASTNNDDLNIGQVLERALPYFDYIDPMVYPSHYPTGYNGYKDVNAHSYDIVKIAMDTAVRRAEATTTTVNALGETPIMETVVVPAHDGMATSTKEVATGMYSKPSFSKEKIRPWLQSFDYPVPYTPAMVKAQIQATEDAGLGAWLFWDAANKYTSLRSVLAH